MDVVIIQPFVRALKLARYDETLEGKLRNMAAFTETLTDRLRTPMEGTGIIAALNVRVQGVQMGVYQTLPCGVQLEGQLWITWAELHTLPLELNQHRMRDVLRLLSQEATEHEKSHHNVKEVDNE